MFEHFYAFFELRSIFLEAQSKQQGRMVRFIQIRDLGRLSLTQLQGANMGLVRKIIGSGLNNYPEVGSKAYFINTPSFFNIVWAIVQPMLSEKARAKTCFLSGKPHEVASELLKQARPPAIECLTRLQHHGDAADLTDWIARGAPRGPGTEAFEYVVKHGHQQALVLYVPAGLALKWTTHTTPFHAGLAHVMQSTSEHGGEVASTELTALGVQDDVESWASPTAAVDCAVVITLSNASSWWNDRTFKLNVEWVKP